MDSLTISGYFRRTTFVIAQRKGFFAKENLDVQFHLVGHGPDHNQELADGVWPITMSSADTMLARKTQDGVDFVCFMQTEQGLDVQLVVQAGIKSFQDLRGTLFASDPVDSNFDLVRNKIMRDNGLNESEYRTEVIGNSHRRLEAFLARKVSAAMLFPPLSDRAVESGGRIIAEGSDYIADWPIICGWGLRRWAEANRPLVVRYIRAMAAATDWLLRPENREETLKIQMEEEKLNRQKAEMAYARVIPKACVNTAALRKNIEVRIELGYYKPPHKATEAFYDSSYWCEATGLPAPTPGGMPGNAVS